VGVGWFEKRREGKRKKTVKRKMMEVVSTPMIV
jgi:hypothetical protein